MLNEVHPKLPMRDRDTTKGFYINKLGFTQFGGDYPDYLMVRKDAIQLHFFLFKELDPKENYGQVYIRTDKIDEVYDEVARNVKAIAPETKPWMQREFSILDPDNNLLTFGQFVG